MRTDAEIREEFQLGSSEIYRSTDGLSLRNDSLLSSACCDTKQIPKNLISCHRFVCARRPVFFREIKHNADRPLHTFAAVKSREDTNIRGGCYCFIPVIVCDTCIDMMLVIEVPRSILQVVEHLRHGSNSSTQAKDIFGVLLIQELCYFIDRHLFHDTGAIYAVDGLAPDVAESFCQVMRNTEAFRENHLFMAAEKILHELPDIQRCIIVDFCFISPTATI